MKTQRPLFLTAAIAALTLPGLAMAADDKKKPDFKDLDKDERFEALFESIDKDEDGRITRKEFGDSRFAKDVFARHGDDGIDRLFFEIETDRDGEIEENELRIYIAKSSKKPGARPGKPGFRKK